MISADDIQQSVFWVSDGWPSSVGVIVPRAMLHRSMIAVICELAIGAAIGLRDGEFLPDQCASTWAAISISLTSFFSTAVPAIPFWR